MGGKMIILTEQMKKDIAKLKGNKMDLSQWEEVPDEDLWQDGELNSNQVMDLIYIRVIQEGNWKLIRRKDA
jgi:hypothetical protein